MQTLTYRYLDSDGATATAQAVVTSTADLERRLAGQGCLLLATRRAGSKALVHRIVQWRARAQLDASLLQLVQMLEAGLPLLDALRVLPQAASGQAMRRIAAELAEDVASGALLSEALQRYPMLFSPMLRALVGAGERSGRLAATLEQARTALDWQRTIRRRLASALLYPLMSMLALCAALLFLLWKVVPSLRAFLEATATAPGAATRLLLAASDGLHQPGTGATLLSLSIVASAAWLYRGSRSRSRLYRWLPQYVRRRWHSAPRSRLQQAALLRASAMLYEAGVDLVEALRLNRNQLATASERHAIDRVVAAVSSGVGLDDALADARLLPAWVSCVLSSSRERASVLRGLRHAADGLERDALWRLARRDVLLPGVLLAVLGTIMLTVVSGLVVPLMTLGLDAGALS